MPQPAVFELFLGRRPSATEMQRWSEPVHHDDRTAVTIALASSDEWAGGRVDLLYRTVLGRSAEAAGRAHWVDQIRRGLRLEDVAAEFYGSDEYFRRSGATHGSFVDALYRGVLGRAADAGGRAHWVDQLDRRTADRRSVSAGFYASVESRRDRVTASYRAVLARTPDTGGLQHWVGQLATLGEIDLAGHLAASVEFHLRSTGVPPATVRTIAVGPDTAYPLTSSWRAGCPVHHRDLRAVEFAHFRDDGSLAAGVLIVHRSITDDVALAVRTMYGLAFPLTGARPVDEFGGDDDRSMAADNSSGFNCRTVAGTTTWSRHAFGTALDINPRRNPYVSGDQVDPPTGRAWTDRSDIRPGMLVETGTVVATFDRLGWGWGGRWTGAKDYQHLSVTGR